MMQQQDFLPPAEEVIDLHQGKLVYVRQWMSSDEADKALEECRRQLAWEQSKITLFGRQVKIPRLNAWYGDPGCHYGYSGYQLPLHDWTPRLLSIRENLQKRTGHTFNSCLANCYRDGNDSVGWHSDDEKELGRNPVIATVSLGAARRFSLKHRYDKAIPSLDLNLECGSLLLMLGETQHFWHHSIPKTRARVEERISLTFRHIG